MQMQHANVFENRSKFLEQQFKFSKSQKISNLKSSETKLTFKRLK